MAETENNGLFERKQAGAGALQGNETDSACEDLEDDEEEWNNEPEPMIPQTVLDLADGALSK